MKTTLLCLCAGLIVGASFPLGAQDTKKPLPVYVYLFAHYEDHINLELSEWRIKEVMRILDDAHRQHPKLVSAVGEFYGADSEIFRQRNRESGIVDLIRRAGGEGWYDVGYHGALLGHVAFWAGRKLEWDGEKMKIANCPDAEKNLRREYRKGWEL